MDPSTYGERIADVYDEWYGTDGDIEGTVATVARCGSSVLELGIGTGRLAIPMVDAGLAVTGIDASPAMVGRLRAKDGDRIPVIVADYAGVPVDGHFDVALLAYNALLVITDEAERARCVRRCAEVADRVIVETFVPADDAPPQGVDVRHVDADEVRLSAFRIDDGIVHGSIVSITESGIRLRPWRLRPATPAELDRVAAAAGLEVEHRWSGWRQEPFEDGASDRCVTVYRRR